VLGHLLVHQAQGVGKTLGGEDGEGAALVGTAREMRRPLAPPVDHQHARGASQRACQVGRSGVRPVVGDEVHAGWIEARQGGPEEEGRPPREQRPQALPVAGGQVRAGRRGERGVVGVGDGVEVAGLEAGPLEAEPHRFLRQLPGRERHGRFPVLAAAEALLLRGRHRHPVDHDRRGGVVEDGVDSQDLHASPRYARQILDIEERPSPLLFSETWRSRPAGQTPMPMRWWLRHSD
jgi:hypothetical protein